MATDDANFVGACRGTRAQQLKNHKKPSKTDDFLCFLAQVARRRGQLLGPLWADLTDILRGKPARVWLRLMQILLGHVVVRGRSS